MADIYASVPTYGGSFTTNSATLSFVTGQNQDLGLGALVQSVSGTYSRPVQRLYELSTTNAVYFVVGRPEGSISMQRIAAPEDVQNSFIAQYGNVCNVATNSIMMSVGSNANTTGSCTLVLGTKYKFSYCLITNFGMQLSAEGFAINEGLTLIFLMLEKAS